MIVALLDTNIILDYAQTRKNFFDKSDNSKGEII
jgi:hypothetical protein